MASPRPAELPSPPRTWIVVGEKQGDNAQVRAIGGALGWPVEERRVAMRPEWVRGKPRVRASLEHIDAALSDVLEAPWPDLLITIGRRLSMVALWVREQSGGHTQIVLVGKPRRQARRFDLIVASAQYRMGRQPNVLRLGLPLMRVDMDAVGAAAKAWRERLAVLPRPLTALLVGGPTRPARFDAAVARQLGEKVRALVSESGGSLYVTTSRRTPAAVAEALTAALPREAMHFHWRPDAPDNPYLALLGLADRFVVTSDSITMMVEVARLARPLAIFPLPFAHAPFWQRLGRGRDLEAIPRLLVDEGRAVRLGAPFRTPSGAPPDEMPRVVEAIRALFEAPSRSSRTS